MSEDGDVERATPAVSHWQHHREPRAFGGKSDEDVGQWITHYERGQPAAPFTPWVPNSDAPSFEARRNYNRVTALRSMGRGIPSTGGASHLAEYVDVGDSSSVEKLFDNTRSASVLPLSIVVNCAGILLQKRLIDCPDELFDDTIRVNLRGTFLVTRAASREMIRSEKTLPEGGAAIVNVSSIIAKCGLPNGAAYAASKAGVVALTKTAAQELADHGIRCNVVLPGWTETPMSAYSTEEEKAIGRAMTPLGRPAQPREIAEAIKFLCSPTSSSFITGAALEVSGGFAM